MSDLCDNYPEKYKTLIDAETWSFIEKTESFYPSDTVVRPLAEQRKLYNAMCDSFHCEYPTGIESSSVLACALDISVPCREYRSHSYGNSTKNVPVVLYLHGGGFVVGGLESHDSVCAEICARTGFIVVSVDYRLAPEHLHPAAYNDAMAAYYWASDTYRQPVILCGDSAGANLAAAVAHTTRRSDNPALAQVLIYPGLGGDISTGSYQTHAHAPMLTLADIKAYQSIRVPHGWTDNDATLAPLHDTDFSDLPPTTVFSAECDPLCDDGVHYARAITDTGGTATVIVEPGLVHGYLRARHEVARARNSFDQIVDAVRTGGV